MLFTTKIASALLAITACALSARSAVVARNELAELSVVFFDDTDFIGATFSPDSLVQGVCSTLPGDWLDRAQSVDISPGFTCIFYELQGCEGPGSLLVGNVPALPPGLYDNIESFFCHKML